MRQYARNRKYIFDKIKRKVIVIKSVKALKFLFGSLFAFNREGKSADDAELGLTNRVIDDTITKEKASRGCAKHE